MQKWAIQQCDKRSGFTIVELIVVIVVIAILAAIVIVAYNGISGRTGDAALRSETLSFAKVIENDKTLSGSYPTGASTANSGKGLVSTSGNAVTYSTDSTGATFCIQVANAAGLSYYATQSNLSPIAGACPSPAIQTITTANCPTARTKTVDARDNRTYWVQKFADNKCWMLTNLAYAGGGTNTYGDVMPTGNGSAGTLNGPDNAGSGTYTLAKYYISTSANPTSNPTDPSTATTGSGQYGYFYNWCAAMKGQATAACANALTPAPNVNVSICPAGWRLPALGEYGALNTAVNGGVTNTDTGLRGNWLGQRGGIWDSTYLSFMNAGIAYYWTSYQPGADIANHLQFYAGGVYPDYPIYKSMGSAVRCVAS